MPERKKLTWAEHLILQECLKLHKVDNSGPASVIRKAKKLAQKQIENSILPEVLENMAQEKYAKLTLEERISAVLAVKREKFLELEALNKAYADLLIEKHNSSK